MATTDDIRAAVEAIGSRQKRYELSRNYYYGNQRAIFMSDEYRQNYGWLYSGLRCNMCKRVVDAMVDRLTIKGFGIERDDARKPTPIRPDVALPDPFAKEPPDPLTEEIDRIWKRNRMDQRAGEVHHEVAMAGDAYVMVWQSPDDPAMPIIYPNRGELMTVTYDEEIPGRIIRGAKRWLNSEGFTRLTLYYPDRIERFISRRKASDTGTAAKTLEDFKPYQTDNFKAVEANPFGMVPVFHFANNAGVGMMGHSELNDVLPLQDILNKSLMDVAVSMEFNAYKQRYAVGLDVDIDPATGAPIKPFAPGRDHMWSVPSPDVKFGEFSADDPTPLDGVSMSILRKIALVSGTPLHYFNLNSGDFPSGEALKTAEAPFVAKIKDRQTAWGNVWEDVMAFAVRVSGAKAEGIRLSTEWEDAAPTSQKDLSETLLIHQQLEPLFLEKAGYTPDEIAQITGQRASAGEMAMMSFTNGPGRNTGTPDAQAQQDGTEPTGNEVA